MGDDGELILPPASTQPEECPMCTGNTMIVELVESRFIYGTGQDAAELSCTVPIHRCPVCRFEFTDYQAEDARELAIRRHLQADRGK